MYHLATRRTPAIFVTSAFLALSLASASLPCLSSSLESPTKTPQAGVFTQGLGQQGLKWPLPPAAKLLKQEPQSVEIYQYDDMPVGNRRPLLMVHGLRGEFWRGFRWKNVTAFLLQDRDFRDTYKIYFVRYNTHVPLPTVKPSFKKAVRDLAASTGNKPISVVALSMGGSLIQEAMEDDDIANVVDRVVTMGTSFHGSPLFCFDWMKYSMLKHYWTPWQRLDLCVAYKLYFDRHQNLLSDLKWDDSDKRIPDVGPFHVYFPWHFAGDLTPSRMDNPRIAQINSRLKEEKNKFITYGGYLKSPYGISKKPGYMASLFRWPGHFVHTTIPEHLGREHPVLRALNRQIGQSIPSAANSSDRSKTAPGTFLYGLNDGITPLASALFLPQKILLAASFTSEADIPAVKDSIDVRKARIFANIDHLTFIDGYRPPFTPAKLKDELSPEEGAKMMFQWLLDDLMEQQEAVAGEGRTPLKTGQVQGQLISD